MTERAGVHGVPVARAQFPPPSMMSYSMVIGSYFVAVERGDKTRSQVLQLAIDHLLR